MKLVVALVAAAACSKQHAPPACTGKHQSHVEILRVDENSPYMKQAFAHVGSDLATGAASDPAALAAGVRAEVDQWRHDDKTADGMPTGGKAYTDYYLTAPDRKTLEAYAATLEPPPTDRELVYEPVTVKDKHYVRSYYVIKPALLDDTAFTAAELLVDPNTTWPFVWVTMRDPQAWERITAANVGHRLATLVDGEVVVAPIIEQPIKGGRAAIHVSSADEGNVLLEHLGCPHS